MKRNNKIKVVSLSLILALLLGVGIGYSQVPSSTTWLQSGSLIETADFVFWRDGSNYFVKDGETGRVTSSTNASLLFQTVCANPNDLTIFLKKGTYNLDNGFYIDMRGDKENFALIAEKGAILNATTTLSNAVWGSFIEVYAGKHLTIEGLTFNDNEHGTNYGIRLDGYSPTNNTEICGNNFYNFISSGTTYLGICIASNQGINHYWHNNYFENCEQGLVASSFTGSIMTNLNFADNIFVGVGHSINIENTGGEFKNVKVSGNSFYGSTLYSRASANINYINVFGVGNSQGVSISGNNIYGLPSSNATGISAYRIPRISISGNTIYNCLYNDTGSSIYEGAGAININGCPYASIIGNTIGSATIGINILQYIDRSDYVSVCGNIINDITDNGLHLRQTSYGVYVGNVVEDAGKWGLIETYYGSTENNTISSSMFTNCILGGVSVLSNSEAHLIWNNGTWVS